MQHLDKSDGYASTNYLPIEIHRPSFKQGALSTMRFTNTLYVLFIVISSVWFAIASIEMGSPDIILGDGTIKLGKRIWDVWDVLGVSLTMAGLSASVLHIFTTNDINTHSRTFKMMVMHIPVYVMIFLSLSMIWIPVSLYIWTTEIKILTEYLK